MSIFLCIHGHFYQPPREDPWLGRILNEASAAPMHDWNERILRESYAPLAFARQLDGEGRVDNLLNCYEWMSFNVGPTLLDWIKSQCPALFERLRDADSKSLARLGHGNAMAQVYHHAILPLSPGLDQQLEVCWGLADFEYNFGRKSEGMWLSECAADARTLEILAAEGVKFVILSPAQASAVINAQGETLPVDEHSLKIGRPYKVCLPSGAELAVFFYSGEISRSVAFEGLLHNGEHFWKRIADHAWSIFDSEHNDNMLTVATDGETYGHHFAFGEMALAYVLSQGKNGRDQIRITNPAAFLAANPPVEQVILRDPSSWSCVHGVERWRGDCGCTNGDHPGWNQAWRGPLRRALDEMRKDVCAHYDRLAPECFKDPAKALLDYGRVLADRKNEAAFAKKWFKNTKGKNDLAWKLLDMQEKSLAAYASCAWFFDDIQRIEPENAMTYAMLAMDMVRETGGPDLRPAFQDILEEARSNQPGPAGPVTGRDVFINDVEPRRDNEATLCLMALILLQSGGEWPKPRGSATFHWPNCSVEIFPGRRAAAPEEALAEFRSLCLSSQCLGGKCELPEVMSGTAVIRSRLEEQGRKIAWYWLPPGKVDEAKPGSAIVPVSESRVLVVLPDKTTQGASVDRLSQRMAAYMQSRLLADCFASAAPCLAAQAAQALSLIRAPGPDGAKAVAAPELWAGFAPFMIPAFMKMEGLPDDVSHQVVTLVRPLLCGHSRRMAQRLVEESFAEALAAGTDDGVLAQWALRCEAILPEMEWWGVQNIIWTKGLEKYPQLARTVYFSDHAVASAAQ